MRLLPRIALAILSLALLGAVAQCSARALDTPGVTVGDVSRVGIFLRVTAGPSGAPAGFTVQWMTQADYDRLGGWPADEYDPSNYWCTFYGVPTCNPSTGTYQLAPDAYVDVEMGDVFDETGVSANSYDELPSGVPLVLRVHAEPAPGLPESAPSPTLFVTTMATPSGNCTYTQGYWKNHFGSWPVAGLTLGTVYYTNAQLLAILNTPAAGNGLLILAHQLIATKLNIANGADPTPVSASVTAADALIGGLVIPPVGGGFLAPSTVTAVKDVLDEYNNGFLGVPHCGEVAAKAGTWGGLKAVYR